MRCTCVCRRSATASASLCVYLDLCCRAPRPVQEEMSSLLPACRSFYPPQLAQAQVWPLEGGQGLESTQKAHLLTWGAATPQAESKGQEPQPFTYSGSALCNATLRRSAALRAPPPKPLYIRSLWRLSSSWPSRRTTPLPMLEQVGCWVLLDGAVLPGRATVQCVLRARPGLGQGAEGGVNSLAPLPWFVVFFPCGAPPSSLTH